jgi:hypothetical protein
MEDEGTYADFTGVTSGFASTAATIYYQTYGWDGLNCYYNGLGQTDANGEVDVLSPEVFLNNAKIHDLSAAFVGPNGHAVATLNVWSSAYEEAICGDQPQPFNVTVNFTLPPGGQLVESRCSVQASSTPSQNYNIIGDATCSMDAGLAGHLSFTAQHRCCHGPDTGINITIGANKSGQTGTIDTRGAIIVKCNQ